MKRGRNMKKLLTILLLVTILTGSGYNRKNASGNTKTPEEIAIETGYNMPDEEKSRGIFLKMTCYKGKTYMVFKTGNSVIYWLRFFDEDNTQQECIE